MEGAMNVSQNTDKKKIAKTQRPIINNLFQESLGYIPMRMKPVHFATGFLLCLHPRYRTLEFLNKAANPKVEEKCVGDEYVAENLYPRLVDNQSILDSVINIEALKLLRNHLNAAYNNDSPAMYPVFEPYKPFGCDYSTPSLNYLSNSSKHGNAAGALVWLVLNSTAIGQQFLKLAKEIALSAEGPATALGLPLIEDEDNEFQQDISQLCGNPSALWLSNVSELMKPQTEALLCLAINLDHYPSAYALRKLILGVGSWLLVYQIRQIPGLAETIFFCDFAGDVRPQLRTQAMACYARQLSLFGRSLRLWLDCNMQHTDQEKRDVLKSAETEISKELEDHFRDFSERIGWVQPRSGTKNKYFRTVPDTLSVLLRTFAYAGR
jgi:hypothetical protein